MLDDAAFRGVVLAALAVRFGAGAGFFCFCAPAGADETVLFCPA